MYTIRISPDNLTHAPTRRDAVRLAKDLSARRHRTVRLLRNDGWERMVFKDGELHEATLVTHDQRGRVAPLAL